MSSPISLGLPFPLGIGILCGLLICFSCIKTKSLKKYAYAIEWKTFGNYFYGHYILKMIIPNEDIDYYFKVLRLFYERNSMKVISFVCILQSKGVGTVIF